MRKLVSSVVAKLLLASEVTENDRPVQAGFPKVSANEQGMCN